ncbi:MAG: 6-phosphogluconolactonase, partial [Ktedonobacterales bacterium]
MPETNGTQDKSTRTHLQISPNLNGVARGGADLFVRLSRERESLAEPGSTTASVPFTIALSGGTTPRALNQLLTSPPYIDMVDWSKIDFFWGDERCVAPDDPLSNYRMARETLLAHVPVTESQIHR